MAPGRAAPVVVIGASAAGLAVAACLKSAGISADLLERSDRVGATWRGHYDRLHLHTSKGSSALPGLPFPADHPRYPSRDQVVAYLERYAAFHGLTPSFGETVLSVTRDEPGWSVQTDRRTLVARHVVVATGYTRVPWRPTWPGQDTFAGEILHSSAYSNGERWRGRRVLVVGFGNSGGEIAIDLVEHGASPTLAVRGAVNVLPRDLFGVPILAVASILRLLPPRLADQLGAPLLRLSVGDIANAGLRKLPYGAMEQIQRDARIPLLDVGTLALLRAGRIRAAPGVRAFTPGGVVFDGGEEQPFDAVVLATGYRACLGDIVPALGGEGVLPGGTEPLPGLHLCGFVLSTRGMLNEIGHEARAIAKQIAAT
jgi:indole-3-pyruvate monooxygenase